MRIQHNITAMNAYRNYTSNTSAVAKNLEKLSSGYKINRAGDDAAGLAISEKMRAQVTGLDVAQKNAKDGISLVQTAEGALTEVHDMLNRMYELSEQSANGVYDDTVDRANLQKEINSLSKEIDRIADSANFNGINLLDGSLAGSKPTDAAAKQLMKIQASAGTLNTATGRQDAVAEGKVFASAALGTADYDAYEISFVNSKGETKSIKLVEGTVGAIGAAATNGATLADALAGRSEGLDLTATGNDPADLAEFRELFNITGAATGSGTGAANPSIKIQAKDAASGAKLLSIKHSSNAVASTAVDNLATASTVAVDANSVKAESAGYAVDFDTSATIGTGTTIAVGTTLKIGNTTYEIQDGTTLAKEGHIGVNIGATNGDTVKNLVAQLKKDGYSVEVSGNDASKIIFDDMSKLMTTQGGTQISSVSSALQIDKVEAAKQSTTLTIGSGTAGAQKLTINYLDENGKKQTKEFAYTGSGTDTDNANAIAAAIKNDADLLKLFNVGHNTGDTTITLEARGTGAGSGELLGVISSDVAATSITPSITGGAYEGKTVSVKSGENIKNGETITVDGVTYEFSDDASKPMEKGNVRVNLGATGADTMKNFSKALEEAGVKHSFDAASGKLTFADKDAKPVGGGLTLQIGDTAEGFNKLTVSIKDMHIKAMGIADIDVSRQDGADAAMKSVKEAINYVSDVRGDLGATQNRLEHTINNLSVMQENIQDAESSIRDVDVAKEMMSYTKNNILVQSAQAMLAQANQLPQGVLQLLQ